MRTSFEPDFSKAPQVWQAACRYLEETQAVTDAQFKLYIGALQLEKFETQNQESVAHLLAPNDFCRDWISQFLVEPIQRALETVSGSRVSLSIQTQPQNPGDSTRSFEGAGKASLGQGARPDGIQESASLYLGSESLAARPADDSRADIAAAPRATARGQVLSTGYHSEHRSDGHKVLDPAYTFERFVIGASNQFAYASSVAVAEKPGNDYNPLFIYSPPGLGKTHLLHAIGNLLILRNPQIRVCFISAEGFMNELIESIQHQRMPAFRAKYRNSYDVLLVDDIQSIAGKTSTEEEFFHTFNSLYARKKQIVLTSDRQPKDLTSLEDRIRTRFEQGLIADIQPPEIETRIAILKAKAEQDDIYLPDDVANLLATHVREDVRKLEGALTRLKAHASLAGVEISLDLARSELSKSIQEESAQITVETIQSAVARQFQIRVIELKSTSRKKTFTVPRHIATYLVRKYIGLGYDQIGQHFGGRNHSTIMHGISQVESRIESDPELRSQIESIQNCL